MRSIAVLIALMTWGFLLVTATETDSDAAETGQPVSDVVKGQVPVTKAEVPDVAQGTAMLARQPVAFIENQGQWDGAFSHLARFGPMAVFLEDRGWAFTLTEYKEKVRDPGDPLAIRGMPESEPGRSVAMRMRFANGADAATSVPEERLPGVHNYFLGNDPARWKSNVPLHGSVRMAQLYPGIDVRARSGEGHFEYDLLVEPGADLARVQVEVEGSNGLHIDADGTLVIETALGPVRQPVPETWQVTATGKRQEIACSYVLLDNTRFGFAAPERDRGHALVVDPGLIWSTFLGGASFDIANALTLDASGVVTVMGRTSAANFPTTPGAFDTTYNGNWDVAMTRLSPNGSTLLWSTFLGGTGDEYPQALTLDASGAVTLAGTTSSANFPTTAGAFDTTHNGGYDDAFVTRLSPSGSTLLWSTFLGSGSLDSALAIALHGSGAVAVAGSTSSAAFPTTQGAFDTTHNGNRDIFVALLHPNGSTLLWSTFLGGGGSEYPYALGIDASGMVTVAGSTLSTGFPTTPGAFDTTYNGGGAFVGDAFVARLDLTGNTLLWSTFLGGSGGDSASALALDASGAVTVAGNTTSADFPTTPGAFDTTHNGGSDVFVTRLDPGGSALLWSTFLGAGGTDNTYTLALDASGAATLAGGTTSTDFPTTTWPFPTSFNGGIWDAFAARLSPSGCSLLWSTFLGGNAEDYAYALALNGSGTLTLAGATWSATFPTTPGAFDTTYNGSRDIFVTCIVCPSLPPSGACLSVSGNVIGGNAVTWLQSPAANAPCYVLADTQTGAVSLGAYGSTQIALSPNVVPLADATNTFGTSLTTPLTNSVGDWSFTASIPNDPQIVGWTFYVEAFVVEPLAPPNGLFWQSNLLTVTIQ